MFSRMRNLKWQLTRYTFPSAEIVMIFLQSRRRFLKFVHALIIVISVAFATTAANRVAAASQWAEQVSDILPEDISLTAVDEKPDHLHIVGKAKSNTDISVFMRAIGQAKLGSPNLERIQVKNGVSEFSLQIRR